MRLMNTRTLELREFTTSSPPPYAILSHTWEGDEEVLFHELVNPDSRPPAVTNKKGFTKIREACSLSLEYGFDWCWIDTCCIDKSSSAELSEAINSMFRWYGGSGVCLAYLSDLRTTDPEHLDACRWFTRGWTLQELIAPGKVYFYNASWELVGEKNDHLKDHINKITGICTSVLRSAQELPNIAVAARLSWASKRQTTRMEDTAYCLMGLFDVNMPMLYGEGTKAFLRLQEEILKTTNDLSLFAWRDESRDNDDASSTYSGILATSPAVFGGRIYTSAVAIHKFNSEFSITNRGIRFTTSLLYSEGYGDRFLFPLSRISNEGGETLAIWLRKYGPDLFVRQQPDTLPAVRPLRWYRRTRPRTIYITRETSAALDRYLVHSRKYAFHFRFSRDFEAVSGSPGALWDCRNRLVLTFGEYTPCWGAVRLSWDPPSSPTAEKVEVMAVGVLSHILDQYEPRCYLISLEACEKISPELWEQEDSTELISALIKCNSLKQSLDVDGALMKYTLSATIVEECVPELSGDDPMFCVDVVAELAGTKINKGYINSFGVENS